MKPSAIGLALSVSILVSVGVAHADTDTNTDRSPALALGLSLAGTAASTAAIALGEVGHGDTGEFLAFGGAASLLLTPSLGHFYTGDYFSTGLIIRGAGAGLIGLAFGCVFRCSAGTAEGMLITGAAGVVIGALVDVGSAANSAREWNAKHALTVAPTAISTATGHAFGVGLGGRF